ncbi:MAG: hypothetical protein ABSH48_06670 [Verrucomicrobiota bacterium]|jgi:hypothetical protein
MTTKPNGVEMGKGHGQKLTTGREVTKPLVAVVALDPVAKLLGMNLFHDLRKKMSLRSACRQFGTPLADYNHQIESISLSLDRFCGLPPSSIGWTVLPIADEFGAILRRFT